MSWFCCVYENYCDGSILLMLSMLLGRTILCGCICCCFLSLPTAQIFCTKYQYSGPHYVGAYTFALVISLDHLIVTAFQTRGHNNICNWVFILINLHLHICFYLNWKFILNSHHSLANIWTLCLSCLCLDQNGFWIQWGLLFYFIIHTTRMEMIISLGVNLWRSSFSFFFSIFF